PAPTTAPAPAPDPFRVEEETVGPRPALFMTGVTTWEKAEEQLGGVFAKLGEAAAKLGVDKHGAPLVEYIESDSDDVGYRVLVPVEALPKGKPPKGVKTGQTPAGKALRFRHEGPIEDLEEIYARIDDEVTKRGVDVRSIVEQYDEDALASPEDRVVVDVWVFLK
ncbi:MAG: GyrI-like domain-containing protein, partial [Phyllobacteriaceae bacterium]|nr:GyrI-like domain-containing protein [Phyllobacteriaceae bacterium]